MDLFFIYIPRSVVNVGGYIEPADEAMDASYSVHDATTSKTQLENATTNDFKQMLENVLVKDLRVRKSMVHWTDVMDRKYIEGKFAVPKCRTEYVMNTLFGIGIGDRFGNIWVTPLDVSRPESRQEKTTEMSPDKQFLESIKSRMIVEKVVEVARGSAVFSFDYLMLVMVASMIATFGLAFNSVVAIVASMLVSPIMGPVVAVTFGTTIKDWSLVKMGLFSELVGLLTCICVGFSLGLLIVPFSEELQLPTTEMSDRGSFRGLIGGVLVAIPSGIGVALSILGNNTSSLVGVAISASLLPPAVNTGFLMAIAALSHSFDSTNDPPSQLVRECFVKACFSFLITLANIFIIYIMALAMFKLKEVASIPGKTRFWKDDVKMTREYNDVLRGDEAQKYAERIRKIIPELVENDLELQELATHKSVDGDGSLNHYLSMGTMRKGMVATDGRRSSSTGISSFNNQQGPSLLGDFNNNQHRTRNSISSHYPTSLMQIFHVPTTSIRTTYSSSSMPNDDEELVSMLAQDQNVVSDSTTTPYHSMSS